MENKVCQECNIPLKEELARDIPIVFFGRRFVVPIGRVLRCPDCKHVFLDRANFPEWQEMFFRALVSATVDAAFEARPPKKKERPVIKKRVYEIINSLFPKEQSK
jgi:uncharacterized protein with PIN domain